MEMPRHLSTFRLRDYDSAKQRVIPGLQSWLSERAFHGVAADAPYVACRLPQEEQDEHLNPVFSLIYEGVSKTLNHTRFLCLSFVACTGCFVENFWTSFRPCKFAILPRAPLPVRAVDRR